MSLSAAEIGFVNRRAAESETLTPAWKSQVYVLINEVRRLRQGLWECALISGADVEDTTPDSMSYPDIVDYAKQEVQQLRDDYDEALQECSVEPHP